MRRKTTSSFFFLMMTLMSFLSYAGSLVLTTGEWRPYLSQGLKNDGPIADIVSRSFALAHKRVSYVFLPWKRALQNVKDGLADGSLAWVKTPEREKLFYFSDPLMWENTFVVFQKKRPLNLPTSQTLFVEQALGYTSPQLKGKFKHLKVIHKGTDLTLFNKLLSGHVRAILLQQRVYDLLMKTHPQARGLATELLERSTSHLILSRKGKDHARLIEVFNRSLKALKKTPIYAELSRGITGEDSR